MKTANYTEWLFYHIWRKNEQTRKSCPHVLIPDTVLFRWAQPFFWYFMNQDGQICRKKKDKITSKELLDVFSLGECPVDLQAEYLHPSKSKEETYLEEMDVKTNKQIIYKEYLSKDQLRKIFLFNFTYSCQKSYYFRDRKI